jgi:hypothetical protein
MSNDAKKVSELSISSGLSANDRIVVLTNPTTSAQTQTISVSNLFGNSKFSNTATVANTTAAGIIKVGRNLSINATSFLNVTLLGPYANDAAANTANVQINSLYYDASGNVKIRLT